MGRLQTIFQRTDRKLLNIYVTAGYPRIDDTIPIIRALEAAGADLVELGMPYSDPLADGQVIQQSSAVALSNGMTISKLLNQLQELRPQTQLPVVLMGYMNPIMQYGFERFCAEAAACGVDGLILPDLPEYEFETYYGPILSKHGLDFIFLITPETSEARVRKLDALSSGFLYAVSSSSTTGSEKNMDEVDRYLRRLQSMQLRNPILVGFGIRNKEDFDRVGQQAAGGIIGSAFVKALENSADPVATAAAFVSAIRN